MVSRTNIVLAVLLTVVVLMTALSHTDYSRPNYEFLPEMKRSPAWSPFAKNPNFADQRTMRVPPAGTIARGQLPMHYAATKEDAVRAGDELVNPYDANVLKFQILAEEEQAIVGEAPPADGEAAPTTPNPAELEARRDAAVQARFAESIQHGADVYRVFCISCHGPNGGGDGPVPQHGFPPPPSLLTGKSLKMKDGQLFHILTYGQGSMAQFAAQLNRDQRWHVINFIRDIQKDAPIPETPAPAEAKPEGKPEPKPQDKPAPKPDDKPESKSKDNA